MTITLEHLEEPHLQFGAYFEHQDCKTGIAEYGPFGQNIEGLHPSEIKLGFIGTRETVAGAKEWIRECGSPIESSNIEAIGTSSKHTGAALFELPEQRTRISKILNRDFIGFSRQSAFNCCFQMNDRWDRFVTARDLEALLRIEDKQRRIWELVQLFDNQIAVVYPVPIVESCGRLRLACYPVQLRAVEGNSLRLTACPHGCCHAFSAGPPPSGL